MASRCYLMPVNEFWEGVTGERLLMAALERVDNERRKRAEGMKTGKPQAACVGAGLLLQLAVQDALAAVSGTDVPGMVGGGTDVPGMVGGGTDVPGMVDGGTDAIECEADLTSDAKRRSWRLVEDMRTDFAAGIKGLRVYSALQVMELVERPIELVMDYGEKGKPYLREYPLYFNLSHSGEYVVCAVSDGEIGVDIQKCSGLNVMRIAERFFSVEESRVLEACATEEERRQSFFRLWVRKEAYGKLLGEGLLGVVSANLLPDENRSMKERELIWHEWSFPEGYRIAMCQRIHGLARRSD